MAAELQLKMSPPSGPMAELSISSSLVLVIHPANWSSLLFAVPFLEDISSGQASSFFCRPAPGYCVVADGGVRHIGHGVGGLTGAGYQRNNYMGETSRDLNTVLLLVSDCNTAASDW